MCLHVCYAPTGRLAACLTLISRCELGTAFIIITVTVRAQLLASNLEA